MTSAQPASVVPDILDLLDEWRHLPDYQLERRADIFLAVHLPRFLQARYALATTPRLVPEFPVRLGTIYPERTSNQSCKIDYVAVTTDLGRAYLIELKTDARSRRKTQDRYLVAARDAGMPRLLEGIVKIVRASPHKGKYGHLLRLLRDVGLLALPTGLSAPGGAISARRVNELLREVRITCPNTIELSVHYLQPCAGCPNDIGFEELAGWLEHAPDPSRLRLARSLRHWCATSADDDATLRPFP